MPCAEWSPPKVMSVSGQRRSLIWKQLPADAVKLKTEVKPPGTEGGPWSGGGRGRGTDRCGERPCDGRGGDWSDVAPSRGPPEIAQGHQNAGDRQAGPPEPPEGVRPCRNLDFRLLANRTVRDYASVVLSHVAYGPLSQQPQDTNSSGVLGSLQLSTGPCINVISSYTLLGVPGPPLIDTRRGLQSAGWSSQFGEGGKSSGNTRVLRCVPIQGKICNSIAGKKPNTTQHVAIALKTSA